MNGKAVCCLSVAGTELWSLGRSDSHGMAATGFWSCFHWTPFRLLRQSLSLSLSLSLSALARSAQPVSVSRPGFVSLKSVRETISLSLSLCFGFGNHNLIHNMISSFSSTSGMKPPS